MRYGLGFLCAAAWFGAFCFFWGGGALVPRMKVRCQAPHDTVYLSKDGRVLATVETRSRNSKMGTTQVRDVETGVLISTRKDDDAWCIGLSGDGRRLAMRSLEDTIRVWDTAISTFHSIRPSKTFGFANEIEFSPDGEVLAVFGSNSSMNRREIQLWHISSGKMLAVFPGPDDMLADMTFAPNGEKLAMQVASSLSAWPIVPTEIWVFNLRAKEQPRMFKSSIVGPSVPLDRAYVLFAPDSQTLLIRDGYGTIDLVNTINQQTQLKIDVGGATDACAFAPNGKLLAVCTRGLEPQARSIVAQVYPSLANRLFPLEDHTVLLDTQSGRPVALLPAASHVAFRPDGQTLVTYAEDSDLAMLWDVPPRPRVPLVLRLATFLLPLGLTFSLRRRKKTKREEAKSQESSTMS